MSKRDKLRRGGGGGRWGKGEEEEGEGGHFIHVQKATLKHYCV